jgi:hypothetical protein
MTAPQSPPGADAIAGCRALCEAFPPATAAASVSPSSSAAAFLRNTALHEAGRRQPFAGLAARRQHYRISQRPFWRDLGLRSVGF